MPTFSPDITSSDFLGGQNVHATAILLLVGLIFYKVALKK